MTGSRFWQAYFAALIVGALGCVPSENNAVESTTLEGSVGGARFEVAAASADQTDDGSYVITLADTAEFSCSSSSGLPMSYLQILVSGVNSTGTFDARDRVSFNTFESGVSDGEMATGGTVTIDDLSFGSIRGNLDVTGPQSEVFGDFVADICN